MDRQDSTAARGTSRDRESGPSLRDDQKVSVVAMVIEGMAIGVLIGIPIGMVVMAAAAWLFV